MEARNFFVLLCSTNIRVVRFVPSHNKTIFFCSKRFYDRFDVLNGVIYTRREVPTEDKNPYTMGWITGPPGVGKSTTALAFASTLGGQLPGYISNNVFHRVVSSSQQFFSPSCVQFADTETRTLVMSSDRCRTVNVVLNTDHSLLPPPIRCGF